MSVSLAIAALEAFSSAVKLLPNYDQRKRDQLYYLISEFKIEINKPTDHPEYSSSRIDYLHDELKTFIQVFSKDLN
jgi:hypothetical protein